MNKRKYEFDMLCDLDCFNIFDDIELDQDDELINIIIDIIDLLNK